MKETNQIVKKSNDLITAKYRLTIIQQYVLHNVISQIHIEDTDFKKYEVNVRSIAENHGIDTKNAYRYIKKSALELNKQPIIIGDEIEGIALNWFSSVRYNSNRGTLLVDFHPDLSPICFNCKATSRNMKIRIFSDLSAFIPCVFMSFSSKNRT